MELFDRVVDKNLLVRRINICVAHLISESEVKASLDKERSRQEAILSIRKKYGKNSILRGINYTEGATARERNEQIDGHKK